MATLHGYVIREACKEGSVENLKAKVQFSESVFVEVPLTATILSTVFGMTTLGLLVVVVYLCKLLRHEKAKTRALSILGAPIPTFPNSNNNNTNSCPEAIRSESGPVPQLAAPPPQQPAERSDMGQLLQSLGRALQPALARVRPFVRRPTLPTPQPPPLYPVLGNQQPVGEAGVASADLAACAEVFV